MDKGSDLNAKKEKGARDIRYTIYDLIYLNNLMFDSLILQRLKLI